MQGKPRYHGWHCHSRLELPLVLSHGSQISSWFTSEMSASEQLLSPVDELSSPHQALFFTHLSISPIHSTCWVLV